MRQAIASRFSKFVLKVCDRRQKHPRDGMVGVKQASRSEEDRSWWAQLVG
jgi:hypothetical protein